MVSEILLDIALNCSQTLLFPNIYLMLLSIQVTYITCGIDCCDHSNNLQAQKVLRKPRSATKGPGGQCSAKNNKMVVTSTQQWNPITYSCLHRRSPPPVVLRLRGPAIPTSLSGQPQAGRAQTPLVMMLKGSDTLLH
jgi:hypothetical protein